MKYETIIYKTDDRVTLVELNRPERLHAINDVMKEELKSAFEHFEKNDESRVMILSGAGDRAFSVGYDLMSSTSTPRTDVGAWRKRIVGAYEFTRLPWDCKKPVIAMIDGHCLAGAMEIAQMCDIRYCSDVSTFGVVETRFSAGIVTLSMPWIVGNRCRELIFTGDTFGAAEAEKLGLVNRVYPKSQIRAEVLKIAKRISQVAMDCLILNKRAINNTYNTMGFDPAMQFGAEICALLDTTHTPEFVEFARVREKDGLKAALAWRDEQFKRYE